MMEPMFWNGRHWIERDLRTGVYRLRDELTYEDGEWVRHHLELRFLEPHEVELIQALGDLVRRDQERAELAAQRTRDRRQDRRAACRERWAMRGWLAAMWLCIAMAVFGVVSVVLHIAFGWWS
jgi:hypothetical protein